VVNTQKGRLYTDEYWSGTHYITGDLEIPEGISLTLAPGTIVVVSGDPDNGYNHALTIKGTLNAPDGGLFKIDEAAAPYWKGIAVEGTAILDGVTIRDAERGLAIFPTAAVSVNKCKFIENLAGIHLMTINQPITFCDFINNEIYGIKEEKGTSAHVENCCFEGNTIHYYHQTLTRLTIGELNALDDCENNSGGGE